MPLIAKVFYDGFLVDLSVIVNVAVAIWLLVKVTAWLSRRKSDDR